MPLAHLPSRAGVVVLQHGLSERRGVKGKVPPRPFLSGPGPARVRAARLRPHVLGETDGVV
eukprot:6756452-Pyramimonas_sp.AAC.1